MPSIKPMVHAAAVLAGGVLASGLTGSLEVARAATFTVLHRFELPSDGRIPGPNLTVDASGNIFGTTVAGGTANQGTVFELTPAGRERVLYNFGLGDNNFPNTGVIRDSAGDFFGTTANDGTGGNDLGSLFRIKGRTARFLHLFGESKQDGLVPSSLVRDPQGFLYGTDALGGTTGFGLAWRIGPNGAEKILHEFTSQPDGGIPNGGFYRDAAGDLYGVTQVGGTYGFGTVYRISAVGAYSIIYSFGKAKLDGRTPYGPLVADSNGVLYGAAFSGGAHNHGALFSVTPEGVEKILYSFTAGADGANPEGPLTLDSAGNIYGVTYYFGLGTASVTGTLFKLPAGGTLQTLWTFVDSDPTASLFPAPGVLVDGTGAVIGAASNGGSAANGGTIYKVTP